jgi:predicted O-methyltransferase YrrM
MKALFERVRAWLLRERAAAEPAPTAADVQRLIAGIRAANLTYCGPPKLENLAEAATLVRTTKVPGRWIEAGVALGGSAILLAQLKPRATALDLHDVFGLIPPPTERDGEDAHARYAEIASGRSAGLGGGTYYGYVDDLLQQVQANLRRFGVDEQADGVRCIRGLFEHTLVGDDAVALAHLDCDWYDSVQVCIERLAPRLARGGVVVFDDYSSYSGCRRAVDEWRAREPSLEVVFERRSLGLRRR